MVSDSVWDCLLGKEEEMLKSDFQKQFFFIFLNVCLFIYLFIY